MSNINYQNIGLAGVQTDTFTQIELFFSDTPAPVTEDVIVPETIATAGLAAWTPVHVDASTRVLSLANNDTVKANAITVVEVAAGSPANVGLSVYTAGHFNMKTLNWPAEYTTDAHKRGAFADETANQIRVSIPFYG